MTGYVSPFKPVGHEGECGSMKCEPLSDEQARQQFLDAILLLDQQGAVKNLAAIRSLQHALKHWGDRDE